MNTFMQLQLNAVSHFARIISVLDHPQQQMVDAAGNTNPEFTKT